MLYIYSSLKTNYMMKIENAETMEDSEDSEDSMDAELAEVNHVRLRRAYLTAIRYDPFLLEGYKSIIREAISDCLLTVARERTYIKQKNLTDVTDEIVNKVVDGLFKEI